jgi:hypothetical protein
MLEAVQEGDNLLHQAGRSLPLPASSAQITDGPESFGAHREILEGLKRLFG